MDLGSNPGHVLYETLDKGPNFPELLMIIPGTQQELERLFSIFTSHVINAKWMSLGRFSACSRSFFRS